MIFIVPQGGGEFFVRVHIDFSPKGNQQVNINASEIEPTFDILEVTQLS